MQPACWPCARPWPSRTASYPEARWHALAKDYADRAMTPLREAIAKGYKDIDHMKKDTDLDALRPCADFQTLMTELGTAREPVSAPPQSKSVLGAFALTRPRFLSPRLPLAVRRHRFVFWIGAIRVVENRFVW